MERDYYDIMLTIEAIGNNALLLSDGDVTAWIPFSQIKDFDPDCVNCGDELDFEIQEWILIEKGFL